MIRLLTRGFHGTVLPGLAAPRRDLLDLDAGTLAIAGTQVVVDGRVIESDGKTETPSTSWRSPPSPSRR